MMNEVRTKSRYVYDVGADALCRSNMVKCHCAFQISRYGKVPKHSVCIIHYTYL